MAERERNPRNSGRLGRLKGHLRGHLRLPLKRRRKDTRDMAYKIDIIEGSYAVIDLATGRPAGGANRFRQKNFAEERIRKLEEEARTEAPKSARDVKGRMKADDPDTPDVNEAYEGGKAPKKKKKAPAKKKKATKKK